MDGKFSGIPKRSRCVIIRAWSRAAGYEDHVGAGRCQGVAYGRDAAIYPALLDDQTAVASNQAGEQRTARIMNCAGPQRCPLFSNVVAGEKTTRAASLPARSMNAPATTTSTRLQVPLLSSRACSGRATASAPRGSRSPACTNMALAGGRWSVDSIHLARFCERAGKPLIPLEDTSLPCLEKALGAWCPIA